MAAPLELSCWGGGWGLPSVHSDSLVVMVRPSRWRGRGQGGAGNLSATLLFLGEVGGQGQGQTQGTVLALSVSQTLFLLHLCLIPSSPSLQPTPGSGLIFFHVCEPLF